MNRYAYYYRKYVARDLQSKYLRLKSMNIPSMKSIYLSIDVENSAKFLPAYISLEWLSNQKPQPVLDPRFGKNGPVHQVRTMLRNEKMYEFYDNLFNLYIPSLKKNDLLGKDPIFDTPEELFFDNILQRTEKEKIKFTVDNIHYLLPLEREFQKFNEAKAQDLSLYVEIDLENQVKLKE